MWKNSLVAVIMIMPCYVFAEQICQIEAIPASTPTGQFVIHPDGTATDTRTGLMWKRCLELDIGELWNGSTCAVSESTGFFTWAGALQQSDTVNVGGGFAGRTDWRLPNLKELRSIVEVQCNSPAINSTVFPNDPGLSVWSSSASSSVSDGSWLVRFKDGAPFVDSREQFSGEGGDVDYFSHVRLVRDAQ